MGGRHYSPKVIGAAISSFYAGDSLRQIVEEMKKRNVKGNASLSPDTVGRWVIDYTTDALQLTADLKFSGWHYCFLFSVASPIRNGRQWRAIFACSLLSRYILACDVAEKWNEEVVADFVRPLTQVLDLTERPSVFVVGTNSIYARVLDRLGLSPYLSDVSARADPEDCGVLDWSEGEIMRQIKRAFRMRNRERAALHLRGWTLSHNFANGEWIQRQNLYLEEYPTLQIPRVHIPGWTEVVRRSARNE